MPTLEVPGASLSYTVHGSEGPFILLIAGALGTGAHFAPLVSPLVSHGFRVITYDRRGFSRSTLVGGQDYAHRLERDADDAAALISHLRSSSDPEPAYVFGNSSGAIVALAMLRRHRDLVTRVVSHEPPLFHALPDEHATVARDSTRATYDLYRQSGVETAMRPFAEKFLLPEELAALAGAGALGSTDPDQARIQFSNTMYWFERELCQYPETPVHLDELEQCKDKLINAVGEQSMTLPAGVVAQALARSLGQDVLILPGGHVGYVAHPNGFAAKVVGAVKA